jgi:hypothetical protein
MATRRGDERSLMRPLATVPPAHARLLDRLAREREDRARRLLEISIDRERGVQLARMRREGAKLAVEPSVPRRRRPDKLTAAAMKRAREESGLSDKRLDAQLQRDIDGQQRMLREMVRTGQTRAKVGENTSLFVCGLTASSITVTSEAFTDSNASTSISSPIATQRSLGRNRSRFFAMAFTPVQLFGLGLLQVTQRTRFAYSSSMSGALTASATLAPVGSYSIDAPPPAYVFPFYNAVPHPSLLLTSTITVTISTLNADGSTTTIAVPSATQTIIDRRLSGWTGPTSDIGLLQDVASPSTVSPPAIALRAGSTLTVDVVLFLQLFALVGGTVTVDCLSLSNAGLDVPATIVRLDY